jgi:preprotein translocase subunit YajC
MRTVLGFVAGALLLGAVAVASAQSIEGTIVRIDPQSRVVMLEDGRMYRVTPSTVLVVDNRPAQIATLQPGQRVVIQSGEVVALRDGQYVTVSPAPAAVPQAPATVITQAPPPAVVTQAPAVVTPAPATAVPAGVRQTIHGRIDEVERNGEVTIRTESDTFEVKLNPDVMRHLKKGDAVTLDLTFSPPGAPAASPR